jgi:hypothetical protein
MYYLSIPHPCCAGRAFGEEVVGDVGKWGALVPVRLWPVCRVGSAGVSLERLACDRESGPFRTSWVVVKSLGDGMSTTIQQRPLLDGDNTRRI